MKKALIGLLAIGSLIAVGVMAKRKGKMMREHCEHMAERCKQMVGRPEARDETFAKV